MLAHSIEESDDHSSRKNAHLEVGDELGGPLPERAEEHHLTTFLEEKERVEHLEQVGGWLVDRADHRALRSRHFPDSSHHYLNSVTAQAIRKQDGARERHAAAIG